MQGIAITRKVALTLTADQWALYSDMPGREQAASYLNLGVAEAINTAPDAADAYAAAAKVLASQRRFGAADSEGYHMLDLILGRVYDDWQ